MSVSNRVRLQRILREADGYLELGMPEKVLETLARIDEAGTFRGQQLYLRGEALRALGQYQEAIDSLSLAADLSPSNVDIWIALSGCRQRLGRLDLAIEALEKAQEVDPQQAQVLYNLARYWSMAGSKSHALEYLAKAVDLDGDLRESLNSDEAFAWLKNDPDFRGILRVRV